MNLNAALYFHLFLTSLSFNIAASKVSFIKRSSLNALEKPKLARNQFSNAASASLLLRGGEVLEPKTLDDIEAVILSASASSHLVVIDFSATWCGPCKVIAPLYKELSESEEYDEIVFLKVDVDESPEAAAKYGVSAMPTFLFIKNGEVVERLMGADPTRLQDMLNELK